MKSICKGLSHPGLVRSVNQDAYYIDTQGRFFIVADGMGGHAGGQEASKIAAHEIQAYLTEFWDSEQSSEYILEQALIEANQSIVDDQSTHPERGDMGTTVVVLVYRQEQFLCAHIGDSRLYLFREGKLQQITQDHTWVAKAMRAGEITKEEARIHPWRHVLSQCLGRKEVSKFDIESLNIQPGDRLLLCSDGLTEEVADDLIQELLATICDQEQLVAELVEQAKKAGGADNVTVVIVDFQDPQDS